MQRLSHAECWTDEKQNRGQPRAAGCLAARIHIYIYIYIIVSCLRERKDLIDTADIFVLNMLGRLLLGDNMVVLVDKIRLRFFTLNNFSPKTDNACGNHMN